jgi:hypothetical protein
MVKRKSIGSDPLDWIGEPEARPASEASGEGGRPADTASDLTAGEPTDIASPAGASADDLVPLEGAASYTLERQLLLVDGMLREGVPRPRLNQTLWILLFLLTLLGTGIILFQEARRQWNGRVLVLEGTVSKVEEEKGKSLRVLEQVISEKDGVIREKQGVIAKIESIQQGLAEELRLSREESHELKVQNRELVDRILKPHREGEQPAREAGQPLKDSVK